LLLAGAAAGGLLLLLIMPLMARIGGLLRCKPGRMLAGFADEWRWLLQ
jgi:hypothetical protein